MSEIGFPERAPEWCVGEYEKWGLIEVGTWTVFDADPEKAPRGVCTHHEARRPSEAENLPSRAQRAAKQFRRYGSQVTAKQLLDLTKIC